MRIISASEFLKQSRKAVERVMAGGELEEDHYTLIANEKWVDKSYIIINPRYLASLFHKVGFIKVGDNILNSIEEVRARASEIQRQRNPYYKKGKK